ncbi:hypothetical protein M3G15_13645 [Paenibacillus sp. p3-SID1389]|uniref:hypothetical protein n=1 Tax=Paenibacillus sp. p3-SID1389 TaxID=2916364 RepID=UPI0021A4F162|nr:hypothetical protein [Paenibacillus sp. p3-SID1389]MCT2196181.1 hypothetical protein [Paenibacillus sp. p3-SID1389]
MTTKTGQLIRIIECNHPIPVTIGKIYDVYADNNDLFQGGGEKYIIDDEGKANYSVWTLCKVEEV